MIRVDVSKVGREGARGGSFNPLTPKLDPVTDLPYLPFIFPLCFYPTIISMSRRSDQPMGALYNKGRVLRGAHLDKAERSEEVW